MTNNLSGKVNRITLIIFGIVFNIISISGQNQGDRKSGITIYWKQKIYFNDFKSFSSHQDPNLPQLDNNIFFHGVTVQGDISENIAIGVSTNWGKKYKSSQNGSTYWGGGMAALFFQYRVISKSGFFAGSGIGQGYGKYNYISSNNLGSDTKSIDVDGIYIEPILNVGYSFKSKVYIAIEGSYIFSIYTNKFYVGDNLPNPFPKGFLVSVGVGCRFSYFKSLLSG
jgi:hypothetical protein